MSERPILFSGPMVRAILDGRKTQTRRLVKPKPLPCEYAEGKHALNGQVIEGNPAVLSQCPYGVPGDRLWVREAFSMEPHPGDIGLTREDIPATWDAACVVAGTIRYRADPGAEIYADGRSWSPSIHMPRRASRLTLEVVSVRVERLQEISEADAIKEGMPPLVAGLDSGGGWARDRFRDLWDSINAKRAPWESNPWAWVIEFRRVP